jgi:hypothetical protein
LQAARQVLHIKLLLLIIFIANSIVVGSISAEHGVGQQKASHLSNGFARPAEEVNLMKAIKITLDPDCTLNPGKVLTKNAST